MYVNAASPHGLAWGFEGLWGSFVGAAAGGFGIYGTLKL